MIEYDVIIIGAGPYGLSAAAHLADIRGLGVKVFGEPMSFWERNMPEGMFLRSNWTATRISDPNRALTLEAFMEARGVRFDVPVPIDAFVEYGRWFQSRAAPDLDRRTIVSIEQDSGGFRVIPATGDEVRSGRVIIASGIGPFARRPPEFHSILGPLVSHTSEHMNFRRFRGKDILVIGSGQSALESAALLSETGAKAEVIGRAQKLNWLGGTLSRTLHTRMGKAVRDLLYAPTDVGPAGISQLVARPELLRMLPRVLQDALRARAVRPAGARWLRARLHGVPIGFGRFVTSASQVGEKVRVKFDDKSERTIDHVLLGTGYRIDISKYNFLPLGLIERIVRHNGFPVLGEGLETSVAGLHILGAPAAWTYGPLMQFVSGTTFASRSLANFIVRKGPYQRVTAKPAS